MTMALLIIAGIGVPTLGWLVLHFVKLATKERERADYNEAVAKETSVQAGKLSTVGTDADTLDSLRRKAADKRKREAKGNGKLS